MIAWEIIDTVLLDMDGTLLDLYFDHHLWHVHLPERYAARHGVDAEAARGHIQPRLCAAEGSLQWYCLEHWSREFGLDVSALEHEVAALIRVRPHVPEFLDALRAAGKRVVLATNAHNKSLALKMSITGLASRFDDIVCSHDLGHPKEHDEFWRRLQGRAPFDPASTLFIDDSLRVLRAARRHGIGRLLGVSQPNSRGPRIDTAEFDALESFLELMPEPVRAVARSARETG